MTYRSQPWRHRSLQAGCRRAAAPVWLAHGASHEPRIRRFPDRPFDAGRVRRSRRPRTGRGGICLSIDDQPRAFFRPALRVAIGNVGVLGTRLPAGAAFERPAALDKRLARLPSGRCRRCGAGADCAARSRNRSTDCLDQTVLPSPARKRCKKSRYPAALTRRDRCARAIRRRGC